jgi:hypothetical protein
MNRFLLRSVGAIAILGFFLAALSCAHDQQLVGISVQPSVENFGAQDPTLNVQLRALGHYIHPPVTKDITDQVTWASNTPGVAVVTSTGLLSPNGTDCGNSLISATVQTNHSTGDRPSSGALITGSMTANVTCAGGGGASGGGGGGGGGTNFILSVDFSGAGSGTINSTPAGLGCASQCADSFPSGTNVTLTATPSAGSTFGEWIGCDSPSGQSCSILMNNNRVVTVIFN